MVEKKESEVQRGHHGVWQIHYPRVFPVKSRKALIGPEAKRIIVETAESIQERYAIEMEAIGCERNHFHLLCGAHPKMAPGRIVQIFKSLTAREIFRRKPSVKQELWGGEFWTDGYDAGTVGEHANWETVERYVRQQGREHTELQQLKLFEP